MAAQRKLLKVSPDSELSRILRRAAASGEPVSVDTEDAVYELDVVSSIPEPVIEDGADDDAILRIIGIGSSEPSR